MFHNLEFDTLQMSPNAGGGRELRGPQPMNTAEHSEPK
jgi:hypothetical protein